MSKETRNLRALLEEYGACKTIATGSSGTLTLTDVLDPSALARILDPKLCGHKPGRQDIINAYVMLSRNHEEMEMLLSEMKNVLHYYEIRVAGILNAMDEYSNLHTAFAKGAHALLHNILSDTYIHFHKCKELFTPYLNGYPSTSMYQDCESDISSDSSDDSDFSDDLM